MKKFISLLLFSLLILSLVFSSGANEKSTEVKALGSEPVTITFWHSASDEAGVLMDEFVRTFNETNPYQITV